MAKKYSSVLPAALLGATLAALALGCAAQRPAADPGRERLLLAESFMKSVVGGDHEAAFALLDPQALVNLGRPQGDFYRSLSPGDQGRYRRDFVEGISLYLFRSVPPVAAEYRVTPVPGSPQVLVGGRPGKALQLTIGETAAGPKIVTIEKK